VPLVGFHFKNLISVSTIRTDIAMRVHSLLSRIKH